MPNPSSDRQRRLAVVRTAGVTLGVALTAVGMWLIVTSSTQKALEIGVLVGVWGVVIGASSVFGSRVPAAQQAGATASELTPGQALDLRGAAVLEAAEAASERREFQERLERLLREEVREGLSRELAGLRAEVEELRSELVEKVGGQIRLERIETTRVIGSDLEALHEEVRQLNTQPGRITLKPPTVDAEVIEEAEVVDEVAVVPEAVAEPTPEPVRAAEPEPEPVLTPEPEPMPEPVRAAEPAPPREPDRDPFAGLPRLTPYHDPDDVPAEPPNGSAARHQTERGRRHRSDDDGNDVLARILAREGPRR